MQIYKDLSPSLCRCSDESHALLLKLLSFLKPGKFTTHFDLLLALERKGQVTPLSKVTPAFPRGKFTSANCKLWPEQTKNPLSALFIELRVDANSLHDIIKLTITMIKNLVILKPHTHMLR